MLTVAVAGKAGPRLGFGCFPLTGGYGAIAPGQGIRMIHAVLDAGIKILDTSDAYAAGANEELVGLGMEGRRDSVVLCTKFGWVLDASGKAVKLDSSPGQVRKSCEASLRRLRTDYIDLYFQHRRDPAVPIEETVGELVRLQDEGKVRSFGLSEVAVTTLEQAHAVAPITALQTEYSLWSREPESELLLSCKRLGIIFMAYSPLGRGFLTGNIRSANDLAEDDYRRTNPRYQATTIERNLVLVDTLAEIARRLGHTTSQLALAWLLAQPWGVVPIFSTRTIAHLEENLEALKIVLTPPEMALIGNSVPVGSVQGARHPADHMKTINQ